MHDQTTSDGIAAAAVMFHEDADAYRERQEEFISDLTGTTMLELVLVSTPIPMGIWLLPEAKVCVVSHTCSVIFQTAADVIRD